MKYDEFKKELKKLGMTIKKFSLICGLNAKTASANWRLKNEVPQWVESWIRNYKKMQTYKEVYERCEDELRRLNEYLYEEPLYITDKTTTKQIVLAHLINEMDKIMGKERELFDISNLSEEDLKKMLKKRLFDIFDETDLL